MEKGRQRVPILLSSVSLRTPDTTVSLCPRFNQVIEDYGSLSARFKKRGCVSKSKVVIANLIHWQPLTPGGTKPLNVTWETSYFRSTLACAQSCLHHTCYIVWHFTSFYERPPHADTAMSAFWWTAEGSNSREFLCITWHSQEIINLVIMHQRMKNS